MGPLRRFNLLSAMSVSRCHHKTPTSRGQSKLTPKVALILAVKLLYLQHFSATPYFLSFLRHHKITINQSKLTPKSWHFFCEYLVLPELPAQVQRSSITCVTPPSLSMSVCASVCLPKKKDFFYHQCFYQHWSRYSVSPVHGFFLLPFNQSICLPQLIGLDACLYFFLVQFF